MNTQTAYRRSPMRLCLVAGIWLGLTASALAVQPWTAVIKNQGRNSEYIERFVLNENSKQPIGDNKVLMSMVTAFEKGQINAAKKAANLAAWGMFNEILFIGGSASTLAEQAARVDQLNSLNNSLTKLGLVLGGAQVCLDISQGDTPSALVNSYKTMQGYLIGTLGTRMMQIGGVAAAAVDYFLTYVRTSTWQAFEGKVGKAYRTYYDHDEYANVRSINDWKLLVHKIYDKSIYAKNNRDMSYFKKALDKEIRAYAKRFWGDIDNLVAIGDQNFYFTTFPVVTNTFKDSIETKYRADLKKQLIKRVFPEIARRAWYRQAISERNLMNGTIRKKFNKKLILEVSAKGLSDTAEFRIHKKNGGFWRGNLTSNNPMTRVKITNLAYKKTGMPTRVTLHVGDKVLEKNFIFRDGRAVIAFNSTEKKDPGSTKTMSWQESFGNAMIKKSRETEEIVRRNYKLKRKHGE
jgi:hypothetical protein